MTTSTGFICVIVLGCAIYGLLVLLDKHIVIIDDKKEAHQRFGHTSGECNNLFTTGEPHDKYINSSLS